jgi:hypothetical protein
MKIKESRWTFKTRLLVLIYVFNVLLAKKYMDKQRFRSSITDEIRLTWILAKKKCRRKDILKSVCMQHRTILTQNSPEWTEISQYPT